MDELNTFYTTRHCLIRDSMFSTLIQEQWLILQGGKGSGKSVLAQGVISAWPYRALTISPLNRKGYLWEWVIIADSQTDNSLAGKIFPVEKLWEELYSAGTVTHGSMPLFVLEDGHRISRGLVSTILAFMTMMPQARLLLTGIFNRRQQRELRVLQPVWFEIPAPDSKDYRKVISSHAGIGPETTNTLPEQFIRRCMRRCDGNLHLAARLGGVIRRNKMEGEEHAASIIDASLQREALRYLPAPGRQGVTWLLLLVLTVLCGGGGAYFARPLSRWLPPLTTLLPVEFSRPVSTHARLMAETMSTNESLSLLFSVWGYEVDKGEAWCDQAYRGGMACLSGTETLETLLSDGLPWVATLKAGSASFPVVVIGGGENTLTVLSGNQTWILDKAWFSHVWTGNVTRMWKPSPDGNASITKKSSTDDIVWLDTMLSRVLNVEAEGTGEWSSLLTEKVRQFQAQNKIKVDGVMGQLSLIRLWQSLGESPTLIQERGTI